MSLINWRRNGDILPAWSSMVDNLFAGSDDFFHSWWKKEHLPAVNVVETEKSYDVSIAAPGLKKEDFKIEISKGVLTICAETETEKEEKKDDYMRREFNYSSFKRSFWLPENVNPNAIAAGYNEGILTLTLPKKVVEKAKDVKKIEVV